MQQKNKIPIALLILAGLLVLVLGVATCRGQTWENTAWVNNQTANLNYEIAEAAVTPPTQIETPLLPPIPQESATVVTNMLNETWLDKVLGITGGITNVDIDFYGTYAPKSLPGSSDHWGGGVAGVWNVTQMAGLGMALDWLGQLSLVSANVTLQAPFHPAPKRLPSWTAAPFVLAGGELAYSGNGNFNGQAGVVYDVGAYTRFGHFLGGTFNFGGSYGKWTIGSFQEVRYHIFLGWMYGF